MTPLAKLETLPQGRINAGMPVLDPPKRVISPFEFLPTWFFYTPVLIQSAALSCWHRDWALPLLANPGIKLSGMVGESKHDIFTAVGEQTKAWILPFITVSKSAVSLDEQVDNVLVELTRASLSYPLVAKPDLGCRGVGVKLVQDQQQLYQYIQSFPNKGRFLLQQKSRYRAEAGVFYVRQPEERCGKIISLTLKYSPLVVGDGVSTLKALIERCPRAGKLKHLYLPRHTEDLDRVLGLGEEFQLAFAGSHSRGAIFRSGNAFITEALEKALDGVLADFPGFCYGRLDIKFEDINLLMRGESFDILEINGASSEAAHIWDSDTPLREIFATLLKQYRLLYQIGAKHKQQGLQSPSLSVLMQAWREEKRLTKLYPMTD